MAVHHTTELVVRIDEMWLARDRVPRKLVRRPDDSRLTKVLLQYQGREDPVGFEIAKDLTTKQHLVLNLDLTRMEGDLLGQEAVESLQLVYDDDVFDTDATVLQERTMDPALKPPKPKKRDGGGPA